MPEDNGPPIPPSGSRGVRQTSVPAAGDPTRVEVTRINAQTGHSIDGHEDLLNEIKECCEDQTQTLARKLNDIKEEIRKGGGVGGGRGGDGGGILGKEFEKGLAEGLEEGLKKGLGDEFNRLITQLKTAPAAAEEGAAALGETFGSMAASAKTADQRLQNLNNILKDKAVPQMRAWGALIRAGVVAEFHEAIRDLNFSMQSLATTLKRDTVDFLKGSFREGMELSRTGLVDLHEVFIDTARAFAEGRDNIVLTMKSIQGVLETGLSTPLGVMGNTVEEVGKNMAVLREQIGEEGFAVAKAFKTLEDANVGIGALVELQLRSGIRDDINSAESAKRFAMQLEELRFIGQLTGKQLEEVIKANVQNMKDMRILAHRGLLTVEQAERANEMISFLEQSGRKGTADIIKQLLGAGAVKNFEAALATLPEDVRIQVSQNQDLYRELIKQTVAQGKVANRLQDLSGLSHEQIESFGKGLEVIAQKLIGTELGANVAFELSSLLGKDFKGVQDEIRKAEETAAGQADDRIRSVQHYLESKLTPQLSGMAGTLTKILLATITSGAANLVGGLGGRLLARGGGRGAGLARAVTPATRTTIPVAGAATKAAAGAARGIGGFLGKLVPGLGAAVSGGLALRSFMQGDILGGLLHAGSGVASFVPGPGTAIAAGLSGLALGREFLTPPGTAPAVGPTPTTPPAVTGGVGSPQKMIMEHMQAQTNFLSKLVMLSEESNTIGRDMSDRIGRPERAAAERVAGATGAGAAPYAPSQAVGE